MKTLSRLVALVILLANSSFLAAQPQVEFTFTDANAPLTVEAEVYWGNITVVGDTEDTVRMSVTSTAFQGQPQMVSAWQEFVVATQIGNAVRLSARRPAEGVFESVDLTIRVPAKTRLHLRVEKGGEVSVTNMHDLVEISHRNGSVDLQALRGFAVVNAVNGSIRASFDAVIPGQSMSFITLNGGIDLTLPAQFQADVRIRSNKNGHVFSAFELPGAGYDYRTEPDTGDQHRYNKTPISIISRIGDGGSWLIATTENGPIHIYKK